MTRGARGRNDPAAALRTLGLGAVLSLLLMATVMTLVGRGAHGGAARTSGLLETLDHSVLAARPAGRPGRLPGGLRPAVVPLHGPAVPRTHGHPAGGDS